MRDRTGGELGMRRGAAMAEWIPIVLFIAAAALGVVTMFGSRIAHRLALVTESLDGGRPVASPAAIRPSGLIVPADSLASGPVTGGRWTVGGSAIPRTPDRTPVFQSAGSWRVWNPEGILRVMTQIDDNPDTQFDRDRCALASSLAARIIAGPQAVDALLADLQRRARVADLPNSGGAPLPGVGTILIGQYIAQLGTLRDRLARGELDHRDLGMIQELMYEGFGSIPLLPIDPRGVRFLPDLPQNFQEVRAAGGGLDAAGAPLGPPNSPNNPPPTEETEAGLGLRIQGLRAGQSIALGVSEHLASGASHFILVGRDQTGRLYRYDPWPQIDPLPHNDLFDGPREPVSQIEYYARNNESTIVSDLHRYIPTQNRVYMFSPVRYP